MQPLCSSSFFFFSFLFSEDFTWPGTIIHIFLHSHKRLLELSSCWETDFLPGSSPFGFVVLQTAVHLPAPRKGGLRGTVGPAFCLFAYIILFVYIPTRNWDVCIPESCVWGGGPQDLFLSLEQAHFAKAISSLSTTGGKKRKRGRGGGGGRGEETQFFSFPGFMLWRWRAGV